MISEAERHTKWLVSICLICCDVKGYGWALATYCGKQSQLFCSNFIINATRELLRDFSIREGTCHDSQAGMFLYYMMSEFSSLSISRSKQCGGPSTCYATSTATWHGPALKKAGTVAHGFVVSRNIQKIKKVELSQADMCDTWDQPSVPWREKGLADK